LKKINISYLNLPAQSPSLELNLALSEKVHRENVKVRHKFFMCDRALSSCSVNLLNKRSICDICTFKAKKGFEVFHKRNPNSELITISKKDLFKTHTKKINQTTKEELLLGVHSTIGSQLRLDNMEILNQKWRKIKQNMYNSSIGLYSFFDNILKKNNVDNFIIFNGRLSCARPLVCVSKNNHINYKLFDATNNGQIPMYSTNEMFHSINFEKKNALKTYVKFFNESKNIAAEYMRKKLNSLETNDKVYTKDQKKGHIDNSIRLLKKPLISIFVSSDDEYRFIGSDWAQYGLVDQIDGIYSLIRSNLKKEYDFVVKMHPNQKKMHPSIDKRYAELSKHVNLLFPDNKTDTYSLISYSDLIINFCSTVGAEANYLRKPVVQIGASRFRALPVANYVSNIEEAIDIISSKKVKIMPKRASVVYFCYHGKTQFKLESYKYVEDGVFKYGDELIKTSFLMRIRAVYDKLIQGYHRGDTDFFSKLSLYIPNLIFGTTRVK
jgi:hypothetical protein